MTDKTQVIREKDLVVLSHIQEGRDDTHQITRATTLQDYEVRYSFQKLEEQGLIQVEKPDGMVERMVDGQKRVFKAPQKAQLTDDAEEYLDQVSSEEDLESYGDMSRGELVEKIHQHEKRIEHLETAVQMLKQQFQQKLS